MASYKIVLTGGGTAGHVNPNIALIPGLKKRGFDVFYIGSIEGIERRLIGELDLPYFAISTGKLRRYIDPKNITDVFRVVKGVKDAYSVLKKIRPDVIFSKGGFVSVPVVLAAHRLHIPVIIHESDATPGLANKISFKFTKKICVSFPETLNLIPSDKAVLTGSPIRKELLEGDKEKGMDFCGFLDYKPVLTVMGGSIGSVAINEAIRDSLPELTKDFNVVHLCGKGNVDSNLSDYPGYAQFEYVGPQLNHVFTATDIMVSRAGANAINEILALKKPNILIPLPSGASRGDQIINARSYEKCGYSYVLLQEDVTKDSLLSAVKEVFNKKDTYVSAMENSGMNDAVSKILDLIEAEVKA